MKLRVAILGLLVALCAAPALADSVIFENQGLVSGSASSSGISLSSFLTQVTFGGQVVLMGTNLDSVSFNTGSFTGSLLGGGQFNAGTFQIDVPELGGTVLFASNFSGNWTKLSDDLFKLVGTFSANAQGLDVTGSSTQFFELENEDGKLSFDDVSGTTSISAVPEPATLTLLGTGLVGLSGAVRRKLAAAAK